jgi:glycosyltransferase involved in cell wall biosynthesis
VDLAKFEGACGKRAVRAVYGFRQNEFLIGTVGRLDPIKNQVCLIRALHGLMPQYPHVKLLIVGNGPCYRQLEKLTEQLGLSQQVILLGEQDDVPQLLRSMDVFILPSIAEGISNTILEAMAIGLPVIATHVGGNVELVLNGETGFLVPSQNILALREAIQVYLREPTKARQHGNTGQQRVIQHFSLSKMVATYDSMYSALIHAKKLSWKTKK